MFLASEVTCFVLCYQRKFCRVFCNSQIWPKIQNQDCETGISSKFFSPTRIQKDREDPTDTCWIDLSWMAVDPVKDTINWQRTLNSSSFGFSVE